MVDKYSHYTDRYIYLKAEMQYYKFCILIFLSLNYFYEHTVLFNTCIWLVIEQCLIQEMDLTSFSGALNLKKIQTNKRPNFRTYC